MPPHSTSTMGKLNSLEYHVKHITCVSITFPMIIKYTVGVPSISPSLLILSCYTIRPFTMHHSDDFLGNFFFCFNSLNIFSNFFKFHADAKVISEIIGDFPFSSGSKFIFCKVCVGSNLIYLFISIFNKESVLFIIPEMPGCGIYFPNSEPWLLPGVTC